MAKNAGKTIELYSLIERPFGKSWEEWTTKWWQWFLSQSREGHPARDQSGKNWAIGQNHLDVLFLAGTVGGFSQRRITITYGKAILLPVINVTISYSEDPRLRSEDEMISFTEQHMNQIVKTEASIDASQIDISDIHRVRTPKFDFSFPRENIFGAREGPTQGVGDGYWLFLKPLSSGEHDISTVGSCLSGRVQVGVRVILTVENP